LRLRNTRSMAATLDAVSAAHFFGRGIAGSEALDVARWIAGRQGAPGAYADMFAPTRRDYDEGIRLFTGERVGSKAAVGHILGEEALRALILLDVRDSMVSQALRRATRGITRRLIASEADGTPTGFYCCGTCTVALWRHLSARRGAGPAARLSEGLRVLKDYRDGRGRWRRFPFHYTLLAMVDLDHRAAVSEMCYAAPVCERILGRSARGDEIDRRRRLLAERVLARV
jgi:hypothetical protein